MSPCSRTVEQLYIYLVLHFHDLVNAHIFLSDFSFPNWRVLVYLTSFSRSPPPDCLYLSDSHHHPLREVEYRIAHSGYEVGVPWFYVQKNDSPHLALHPALVVLSILLVFVQLSAITCWTNDCRHLSAVTLRALSWAIIASSGLSATLT